ncbi:MAG TPA: MMPL family transporter [Pirellulaceae bacterium]|jgi:hypothetical protein|nr:MMPL family transporter [Pirellulaceae bacterium]
MSGAVTRTLVAVADRSWVAFAVLALLTGVSTFGLFAPQRWLERNRPAPEHPAAPESAAPEPATPPASSSPPQVTAASAPPPADSRFRLTDYDVVVVAESERFFTPDGSRRLRDVVESLRGLPEVSDVLWMDDVPPINLFSLRDSVFPPATASQRLFDRARERALADPLIGGQMLSEDGRATLILIRLDWLFVESDQAISDRIRDAAERAAASRPGSDFTFTVGGKIPTYVEIQRSREQNEKLYQFIGYGMAFLMALLLFRELRVVAIAAAVPAVGVYWTLGLLRLVGLDDNPFNDIVLPVLISMVGFADGIHLLMEIRRRQGEGTSAALAAPEALTEVGGACFLTSLTTAIGLGSLGLASHEVVREFGWSCVIGVGAAFIAVAFLTPRACKLLLSRADRRPPKRGLADAGLAPVGRIVDWALSHRAAMACVGFVLTIALCGVSATLRPDQRLTSLLPTDSEASRALARIEHVTGGMESGVVRIHWTEDANRDSDALLEVIAAADAALRGEELIGSPMSLKSFVDALPGDPESSERMSLIELLPGALKRIFYEPENRQATVTFRVRDVGIAAYGPVFERVEAELSAIEAEYPQFDLELTGSAVERWRGLYRVMLDLFYSLGTATIVIFVVLGIAYRSIRLGLISLLPNFFPLAFTGACLVAVGLPLELSAVCALTVCLGIAVDDTIHFLSRYQVERRTQSEVEAIRTAFSKTGTALLATTLVIVLGVSTIVFSGMREQRIFAIITCLTLGSALVADLLFLPPLLAVFSRRDNRQSP